jgi:hypothetical protein
LTRSEAELRRESNGRESWVFRAADPRGLLGAHARLVSDAMHPGERVRYLLYSPMWEGRGGPFGIHAEPASHALAVTDARFIVSRDRHDPAAPPEVIEIPFEAVVCLESGSALMLGWLVVHFVEGGSLRSVTVLYRALGRAHFTAAVRASRSLSSPGSDRTRIGSMSWASVWNELGDRFREELEPLVAEAESPIAVATWPAVWARRRRSREGATCAAPEGALVGSDLGLISVGHDPNALPRSPNFGVNALLFPIAALRAVTLVDRTTTGPFVLALRLEIGRRGVAGVVELPFPGERLAAVEDVLAPLGLRDGAGGIAWSS